MPLNPYFERFTLDDDGEPREVVALASQTFAGREVALLVPENFQEIPGDDTDAWIAQIVQDASGQRVLQELDDDAVIDAAWATFEDVLALTFAGGTPAEADA